MNNASLRQLANHVNGASRRTASSGSFRCFASHPAFCPAKNVSWPPLSRATIDPQRGVSNGTAFRYFRWRPWSEPLDGTEPLTEAEEQVAKSAILDKVMKGRQPTDLMLRCASPFVQMPCHKFISRRHRVGCARYPTHARPMKISCLTGPPSGNVKTISGQFKKADLSAEHRLNVCLVSRTDVVV